MSKMKCVPGVEPLEDRLTPATAGTLDPTFGTGGIVTALPGSANDFGGVAVDHLGRVVVAGSNSGGDLVVLRFNPDGTPDTSFGAGGTDLVSFPSRPAITPRAVLIDAADDIIVGGSSPLTLFTREMAFTRLDAATGAPDPGFGADGTGEVLIPAPPGFTDLSANALALDPTGDIVAGGEADTLTGPPPPGPGSPSSFAVVRLTPGGQPDPGFNGGAVATRSLAALPEDGVTGVAMDAGGDIVVSGVAVGSGQAHASVGVVYRLLPSGTPDPGFDGGDVLQVGTLASASAVATDPAGGVYLAGTHYADNGVYDLAVARVTGGGAVDPTFGSGGLFAANPGGTASSSNQVTGLAVRPTGQVVVGGTTVVGTSIDFAVVQLAPDGTLDPWFNPAGPTPGENVFGPGTEVSTSSGLALSPSGQVVVAGFTNNTRGLAAARLVGPGAVNLGLAVGGGPGGAAEVYAANPGTGGQFIPTPVATVHPFGAIGADARVAVGDVDGDGTPDIILVTGPGTAIRVAVVSGKDNTTQLVAPFDPFGGGFTGGGLVAAADLDHDGRAEIVVAPDRGGGPRVEVFSVLPGGGTALVANFFGIDDPNFRGGARPALGDFNKDGTPDLAVAAGFGGGPRVAIFDGKTVFGTPTRLVNDFFAFPGTDATTLRNGVFVAAGDVTGDGFADLIFGGGPGGAPRVFILSGQLVAAGNVQGAYDAPVANFFVAGNGTDRGGVRVAAINADGDTRADVAAGSGEGSPANVRVYLGKNFTFPGSGEPTAFQDIGVFGGATLADGVFVG